MSHDLMFAYSTVIFSTGILSIPVAMVSLGNSFSHERRDIVFDSECFQGLWEELFQFLDGEPSILVSRGSEHQDCLPKPNKMKIQLSFKEISETGIHHAIVSQI